MAQKGDDVSALLVQVGVHMGDHDETVRRVVEVDETESVRALLERLIPLDGRWHHREYTHYVELRFVQPAAEPDDPTPHVIGEPF